MCIRDSAQEDGVVVVEFGLDGIGQNLSGRQVAVASQVILGRLEGERESLRRRREDFQCLGGDLRTDPIASDHCDSIVSHAVPFQTASVPTRGQDALSSAATNAFAEPSTTSVETPSVSYTHLTLPTIL